MTDLSQGARPTLAYPYMQAGDRVGPGFFNPPAGVRLVNEPAKSKVAHARRSYAWRFHGTRKQLVAFSTPIQHIVVIYMENRTPEDLFGAFWDTLNPTTGNYFGVDLDLVNPEANPPTLAPVALTDSGNPNHNHTPGFINNANGKWDKSGYTYVATPAPGSGASPSVANYISLIEHWAYEMHTLQSNEGPSFEAHQYAIAGQSGGLSDSDIAPQGMVNNPSPGITALPGDGTCVTAASQTVLTVNMYSPYPLPSPTLVTPCPNYTTILDLMVDAQPTPAPSPYFIWQYVAKDTTSIWSAPMAVQHLYSNYSADPNPVKTGQPFAVDPDAENFVLNVTTSTNPTPNPARPFAELTFLTPCAGESDHPNPFGPDGTSFDDGPDWLAFILNAIGGSSYWDNTAVIITWDDWGGFWDNYTPAAPGTSWPYHMTPNPYSAPPNTGNTSDPNEWGYRVPLIVVSPYAKRGFVSNKLISQGAILNFIETIFNLGPNPLGGDDLTNGNNDLTDMFDFSQTVATWSPLPSNFSPLNNDECPTATPAP